MAERVGQRLGNYYLTHLLGKGGFAEVYLGEHVRLHTRAAVKVLYTRLGGSDEVESFQREAQTIAHLDHPHIVRVLDFDVVDDTPFLVMGYAVGGTLRQRHRKGMIVPLPTIVDYVKQVADALQYAHDQRVVHRDVKPENMLLGGRGELLLSDFGIAIITQSSRYQGTQDMAGTVAYMAPEQVQGKPRPASDQYSLGVVVYEWLCGDRPFHGSFTEIATQHVLAPPPSLREKVPTLSPAIEHVVMTALAKDPGQRFASVQAFASALEQVSRAGQLGPMTPAPLTSVLNQSQRPTLLASSPMDLWQQPVPANRLSQAYGMTPIPSSVGRAEPLMTLPHQVGERAGSFVTPRNSELAQRGISRRTVVLGLAGLVVAGGGLALFGASHGVVSPGATATTTPSAQLTLSSTLTTTPQPTPNPTPTPNPLGKVLYTYRGHSDFVLAVAWSPDGRRIASGSDDNTVQVWDAATGGNVFTYRGHSDWVRAVAWSPDGRRIASGSQDNTVQVWDAATGGNVYTYRGHSQVVDAVAWSPDGNRIASGSADKTMQVWDAATGGNVYTYRGPFHGQGYVHAVAWSPDGKRIVLGNDNVHVRDAVNGGHLYTYGGHSGDVVAVAWSPDSKRIVSGGADNTVQVWDAANGGNVYTYGGHPNGATVAWSPDGRRIASGGNDSTVDVWDAVTGGNVFTYRGHSGDVVAWSPDGKRIASGGYQEVQVWRAE